MAEKVTKGEESLKGPTSKWQRGKYRKQAESEYFGKVFTPTGKGKDKVGYAKPWARNLSREQRLRRIQVGDKWAAVYPSDSKKTEKKVSSGKRPSTK